MKIDRRLWPANERVAHDSLAGKVEVPLVAGTAQQVHVSVADLLNAPGGRLERQMLFGEPFHVLEDQDGWSFGFAAPSGYCGYVRSADLVPLTEPTHRVRTMAAHIYPKPDIKTRPLFTLPFGAALTLEDHTGHFWHCRDGFLHQKQVEAFNTRAIDPVAVAELFLGVPYLWGGDGPQGIDCSGLIHRAMRACGVDCPRDSDQQATGLGKPVPPEAKPRRGDVVFWKGHVGIMASADKLLHANAYHMATTVEPIDQACARIAASGGGDVTALRRVEPVAG